MCRSIVDIQSVAAEIRRGKKEEDRKKETTGQKYNGPLLHRAAIINPISLTLLHLSNSIVLPTVAEYLYLVTVLLQDKDITLHFFILSFSNQ